MRTLVQIACVVGLVACGTSSSGPGTTPAPEQDATVDPTYCTKYCDAQQKDGTLTGSLRDCEADCCTRVPSGCADVNLDGGGKDAGDGAASDGGGKDAGDGSACATPCGAKCCTGTQGCVDDGSGSGPTCVDTCVTGADCSTGCCAPATNAAGDPIGPYVCKPNDGADYHCCSGVFTNCQNNHCCVKDANLNEFCALPCATNGLCGAAHCVGYTFSFGTTTCKGPTACGP